MAASTAFEYGVKLLSARARTRGQLWSHLIRRGYDPTQVDQALQRLTALGYLDDPRLARDRAQRWLGEGRLGPQGVRARLLAQGVSEQVAERAVDAALGELEFDALAAARQLLGRRGLLEIETTPRLRARAARLLYARGFSEEVIARLLGEARLDSSPGGD